MCGFFLKYLAAASNPVLYVSVFNIRLEKDKYLYQHAVPNSHTTSTCGIRLARGLKSHEGETLGWMSSSFKY